MSGAARSTRRSATRRAISAGTPASTKAATCASRLSAAGFEAPRVWVDPDVLRGGRFHLLNGFDGAPVRFAQRVAGWRPVRAFLGNDVLAIASR